jgi:hypothetical protein
MKPQSKHHFQCIKLVTIASCSRDDGEFCSQKETFLYLDHLEAIVLEALRRWVNYDRHPMTGTMDSRAFFASQGTEEPLGRQTTRYWGVSCTSHRKWRQGML